MRRLVWLVVVGCVPKGSNTPPIPEGGPCPGGSGVYVASYEAGKDHTGWVMPLHAMPVEPTATVPDWAPLDATAAGVSGVPQPPAGPLWLVTPTAPPCPVKIGGYYAAKLAGPPANVSYGVALDGCPAPADPNEAGGLVLATPDSPTGCQLQQPHPIAARMGEVDQQKQWHRPVKETAIPPSLNALVPVHDCRAPLCETLWAFAETDFGERPIAWTGAVNWVQITNPADPCAWTTDRWSGLFVPAPDGRVQKLDTGEHSLVLSAALVDRAGPKALLAEGPGVYATYDLATGTPTPVRSITYLLAPNEAWDGVDHLGPPCERPAAKPAPLPKDAKPVSPY